MLISFQFLCLSCRRIFVPYLRLILCYCLPLMKGILRRITGKSQLLRICQNASSSEAQKDLAIQKCLEKSQFHDVSVALSREEEMNIEENCKLILTKKKVDEEVFIHLHQQLCDSLYRLHTFRRFKSSIEELRKTRVSSENSAHEDKLMKLWNLLSPDVPLQSRKSDQWESLGFQSGDPQTDFRGMGILGLNNLLYFAETHSAVARAILLHSQHPTSGHTFAIVGINITSHLYTLINSRKIDEFLLSMLSVHVKQHRQHTSSNANKWNDFLKDEELERDFNRLYSFTFHQFDIFWFKKPHDVMNFNSLITTFMRQLKKQLRKSKDAAQLLDAPLTE